MKLKRIIHWSCTLAIIGLFSGQGMTPAQGHPHPGERLQRVFSGQGMTLARGQESESVTTPSGLQYVDLVKGTGREAHVGETAVVHYTGWLENGTKFDSSVDRGTPFSFQLGAGRVIKGWDEGVVGMKIGTKRKLTIPSHLGYGPRGAGKIIPPNATLIFEVELLDLR